MEWIDLEQIAIDTNVSLLTMNKQKERRQKHN